MDMSFLKMLEHGGIVIIVLQGRIGFTSSTPLAQSHSEVNNGSRFIQSQTTASRLDTESMALCCTFNKY